jgi:hypothetical protein
MKKTLLVGFFGFVFAFAGLASATSVTYPSTFKLKVGEDVTVSNYQNMKIVLNSVKNDTGECEKGGTTPCPLGNPVNTANPRKAATFTVSTEGGCGPDADSRCLGAPAYSQTFSVTEGKTVSAQALKITVSDISESSASFSVSMAKVEDDGDDDSTTIKPLPPVVRGSVGAGVQGTITSFERIIVCPNGETGENCSVCARGECRPDSSNESVPRKLGEPISITNPPVLELKDDESFVSAVKVDSTETPDVAYEVKANRKARLFFLIPVNAEVTYSVSASGVTSVSSKPWWNFLAW